MAITSCYWWLLGSVVSSVICKLSSFINYYEWLPWCSLTTCWMLKYVIAGHMLFHGFICIFKVIVITRISVDEIVWSFICWSFFAKQRSVLFNWCVCVCVCVCVFRDCWEYLAFQSTKRIGRKTKILAFYLSVCVYISVCVSVSVSICVCVCMCTCTIINLIHCIAECINVLQTHMSSILYMLRVS